MGSSQVVPPLPPGFTLDAPVASTGGGLPPLPPGFVLDGPQAAKPGWWSGQTYLDAAGAVLGGVGKGVANTVIGLGDAFDAAGAKIGIGDRDAEAFAAARKMVAPNNAVERAAFALEQGAEFLALPGPAKVKGALRVAEALKSGAAAAGLARTQGAGDAGTVTTGVLSALPIAQGVVTAGQRLGGMAEPLIRAAIKPTVSAMKRVAGASVEGIEAKAGQLVRFILENRVTTADKARAIVSEAERELERVLSLKNPPTDAPQRAVRYLEFLEKQAAKQGLPATDVAIIRNAAAEVLESSLGKDVVTMVPKAHSTLVGSDGRPIMVLMPETTRALRSDVSATEALERARATSRWDTRKSWGEQKGAQMEASKTVERGLRGAVKAAVPETAPILQRQGMGIRATEALDRAEFRAANRDAVSLPAHVIAAGEMAAGKVPVMAFAANWLRNNQLRAGVYADDLRKAIARGDTGRVVSILHRLGVGSSAQAMNSRSAGR